MNASQGWSPANWLALLLCAAFGGAGWIHAVKWQRTANELAERGPAPTAPATVSLTLPVADPAADLSDANPTLDLVPELDLMRQIDQLTEENRRLSEALAETRKEAEEADRRQREQDALDGTGGLLR